MIKLNGFKTTDLVYLEIGPNGLLNGFNIQNSAKFDNIQLSDNNINNAKEIVLKALKKYSLEATDILFTDIVISVDKYNEPILLMSVDYKITDDNALMQENNTFEILIKNI